MQKRNTMHRASHSSRTRTDKPAGPPLGEVLPLLHVEGLSRRRNRFDLNSTREKGRMCYTRVKGRSSYGRSSSRARDATGDNSCQTTFIIVALYRVTFGDTL